jgi:DNA-binding response OmpR family regulator
MSGYELYKEIRKIDDKIKVYFFTASEAYHEEFRKSVPASVWNEDCYIQKPINNKELIKRINNIITTSSS